MLALDIKQINKSYSKQAALTDVSFQVREGRVHGFLGPNGAGKSTTMKIICGLLKADSGNVQVFVREVQKNLPWVKTQVGVLPENPPLYADMIVRDYLQFIAAIHDVPRSLRKTYVNDVMEKTGITTFSHRLIGNLSKGMQQRVGIAQAMVFRPRILILDEPTVGLDPASILEIRRLIQSLQGEHTILLSSHQLFEVTQTCQDITIINEGHIVASETLENMQHRFQGHQTITAEVASWQDAHLPPLQNFSFVDSVKVSAGETAASKKIIVRMRPDQKEDRRAFLGQYLQEKGCPLLSLSQETQDLEEIFLQLTRGAQ